MRVEYFCGLDLGCINDYSAVSILERHYERETEYFEEFEKPFFNLTHLERFPLGTSYPEIVNKIRVLFEDSRLREKGELIVDSTGVGLPVVQLLEGYDLRPIPIIITGGEKAVKSGGGWNVPRGHIIGVLITVFQGARLKIASGLELASFFAEELENFSYKINKKDGSTTYESMKEAVHDDLTIATGIALWYAARDGLERRNLSRSFGARVTHVEIPTNLLKW